MQKMQEKGTMIGTWLGGNDMADHEYRSRSNKDILSEVERSVFDILSVSKYSSDAVVTATLAKLRKLPTVWYRSERELKIAKFLLTGLISRCIANNSLKRELIGELETLRFWS